MTLQPLKPNPSTPNASHFYMYLQDITDGTDPAVQLTKFAFPIKMQDDMEMWWDARYGEKRGCWCFFGGDRIAYHSAHCYMMASSFEYEGDDVINGNLIQVPAKPVIRYSFQALGSVNSGRNIRVLDKHMPENEGKQGHLQGLPQYPYDSSKPTIYTTEKRPGCIMHFEEQSHLSYKIGRRAQGERIIARFDMENHGPGQFIEHCHEKMSWPYQGEGRWVGVHEDYGAVGHLIVSSVDERYAVGNALNSPPRRYPAAPYSVAGVRLRRGTWKPYTG